MTTLAAAVNGQRIVEMLIQFSRVYETESGPIEASELVKELMLQIRVAHTHTSWER